MKTRTRALSIASIGANALAAAIGGSIAPSPKPRKQPKAPEERVESRGARKARRRNKGHSDTAEEYRAFRRTPAGRSSTLKKTAKLYRLMGWAPEVRREEKARHVHPRHCRPST